MKRIFYSLALPVVAVALMGQDGCDQPQTATQKEAQAVAQQQALYVNSQPPPVFDWSLERHLMTELYKARNNAVATYSYIRNQYTGKILSSCPSIGFPIQASTQLTNPSVVQWRSYGGSGIGSGVIPQPEPNGLFAPAESRGTYVMCLNKDGKVVPRYYEEDVEAYVTPMKEVNGELVEVEGGKPSIVINPSRPN